MATNNATDLGGYQATPAELDQRMKDLNNAAKTNARSNGSKNNRRRRTPDPVFAVTSRRLTPAEIAARDERNRRSDTIWERVADAMPKGHQPIEHRDGKPARRGTPRQDLPVTGTSPFGNTPAQVARKTPIRPASANSHKAATARDMLKSAGLEWNGAKPAKTSRDEPRVTRDGNVIEPPLTAGLNRGYGAAKGSPRLRHGLRQDR